MYLIGILELKTWLLENIYNIYKSCVLFYGERYDFISQNFMVKLNNFLIGKNGLAESGRDLSY